MEPLVNGYYYHIYNRGINSENLFIDKNNYEYFLNLYNKYIPTIAESFAWCLMPNHFHFLVKIKELEDEVATNSDRVQNPVRVTKPPHLHFSHLFNAYTQAFNKYSSRHGSLFERPFKRKLIKDDNYLKQLIIYIHNNPVKHEFVSSPQEYPWSTYGEIISNTTTKLPRNEIIDLFSDRENFIACHKKMQDFEPLI